MRWRLPSLSHSNHSGILRREKPKTRTRGPCWWYTPGYYRVHVTVSPLPESHVYSGGHSKSRYISTVADQNMTPNCHYLCRSMMTLVSHAKPWTLSTAGYDTGFYFNTSGLNLMNWCHIAYYNYRYREIFMMHILYFKVVFWFSLWKHSSSWITMANQVWPCLRNHRSCWIVADWKDFQKRMYRQLS